MSQENIMIVVLAAVVAFLVGLLVGRMMGSKHSKRLSKTQKELQDYKEAVSEHFGKTADLIDNLTASYKDVFDHLGSSAKQLLTEEQVKQHLASRSDKAITLTYETEAEENDKDDKKQSAAKVNNDDTDAETANAKAVETETTDKVETKPL
ncbi:MAG: hypothetical protein CSA45_02675 [Gammaproteobacteria bacterium]|nr:MAG: hypothetical protein CSA45_02675 [Gammaproteobacteria bacterium]